MRTSILTIICSLLSCGWLLDRSLDVSLSSLPRSHQNSVTTSAADIFCLCSRLSGAACRKRSTYLQQSLTVHICQVNFTVYIFVTSLDFAVWNDLPSELKNSNISRLGFKSSLKSWLFECAYLYQAPLWTSFKRRYINLRFDWLIDWLVNYTKSRQNKAKLRQCCDFLGRWRLLAYLHTNTYLLTHVQWLQIYQPNNVSKSTYFDKTDAVCSLSVVTICFTSPTSAVFVVCSVMLAWLDLGVSTFLCKPQHNSTTTGTEYTVTV